MRCNPPSSCIPSHAGRGESCISGEHPQVAFRFESVHVSRPRCAPGICSTCAAGRAPPKRAGRSTTRSGACSSLHKRHRLRSPHSAAPRLRGHAIPCRFLPQPGPPRSSLASPSLRPTLNARPTAIWACCICSASPACTSGSGAASCAGSCPIRLAFCAGRCWSYLPPLPSSRPPSRAPPWPWDCAMPAQHAVSPFQPGASGPSHSCSRLCVTPHPPWVSCSLMPPQPDSWFPNPALDAPCLAAS